MAKNGFFILNPPRTKPPETKTVIVLGAPRGGTSMVSGVLRIIGVPMGKQLGHQHEDPRFMRRTSTGEKLSAIREMNESYPVWGWKMPDTVHYIQDIIQKVRNPYLIVIYRSPLSIAASSAQRDGRDLDFRLLNVPINHYRKMHDFLRGSTLPCAVIGYEQAMVNRNQLVEGLAAFLNIELDDQKLAEVTAFINPDKGYQHIAADEFQKENPAIRRTDESAKESRAPTPIPDAVRMLNGRVLTWDEIHGSCGQGMPGSEYPALFLDIPRTGGGAVKKRLDQNYDSDDWVYVQPPKVEDQPSVLYSARNRIKRFVMGRHAIGGPVHRRFRDRYMHVTLLRHPLARTVASYMSLTRASPHSPDRQSFRGGLKDAVSSGALSQVYDQQALIIAGINRNQINRRGYSAADVLEIAKENLEFRFTFFGLLERFDEFLFLANRLLGWESTDYNHPDQSRAPVPLHELSRGVQEVIEEQNQLDLELYTFAGELIDDRLHGSRWYPREEFEEFQRDHGALISPATPK